MIKYVERISISSHKRANLQNLVKVVSMASDPDRKARLQWDRMPDNHVLNPQVTKQLLMVN